MDNMAREIDVLIAEQVLGHHVIRQKKGTLKERTRLNHLRPLRAYSADIAAAWEVVERAGVTVIPIENEQWFAFVGKGSGWKNPAEFLEFLQKGNFVQAGAAVGASAPMAICLAALKAVEKYATLAEVQAAAEISTISVPEHAPDRTLDH